MMHVKKKLQSKQKLAYEQIKNAIVTCQLKPGSALIEMDLSEALGISRTPIREALHKLSSIGLVDFIPGKGAFVSNINREDVIELFELIEVLEIQAINRYIHGDNNSQTELLKENLEKQKEYIEGNTKVAECFFDLDNKFHDLIVQGANRRRLMIMLDTLKDQVSRLRALTKDDKELHNISYKFHESILNSILEEDSIKAGTIIKEHYIYAREYHLRNFG